MRLFSYSRVIILLHFAFFIASPSFAQTTIQGSVNSLGGHGNKSSTWCSISSNGRYVTFHSYATNLVPGDANASYDIFVYDLETNLTERVSVNSLGGESNGFSQLPSISAGGRFVAFSSGASNLVLGDTNGRTDIFVHDRQAGTTERVSVSSLGLEANDHSSSPSISADGRYVAFDTLSDLDPGDTNGNYDVYVFDCQTGVTERVSVDSQGVQGTGTSSGGLMSADGRYVAFTSAVNSLVPGDTNNVEDAFVHDRQTHVTERVSVDSQGIEGLFSSWAGSISSDGRYVSFGSTSPNLVLGDTNTALDVFVHDRQSGETERVSVNSQGTEGNRRAGAAKISADGQFVAFQSWATNLVQSPTPLDQHIYVHNRQTNITERVSVNSQGGPSNSYCDFPTISEDGRIVSFASSATNLVPGNTGGRSDVYVHDRWDGLGSNSIYLAGPSVAPTGVSVALSWSAARPNSRYWLARSMTRNGSVIGGHGLDIGSPQIQLASGFNSSSGTGAYTSLPVPSVAAGHMVFFEVLARDAGGVFYDSNVLTTTFN